MENKSAMQILIDDLKQISSGAHITHRAGLEYAIGKANELLEVEKKNIVEAFDIGVENCGEYGCPMYLHGEEYYSTKFNNQK